MTEGEPISVTDHLECRASGWDVDRSALNGTSAPLEHVKTHCPALIATLVAIAQAAKDNHEVDDQPRPTVVPVAGRAHRMTKEAAAVAREFAPDASPRPTGRNGDRPL